MKDSVESQIEMTKKLINKYTNIINDKNVSNEKKEFCSEKLIKEQARLKEFQKKFSEYFI